MVEVGFVASATPEERLAVVALHELPDWVDAAAVRPWIPSAAVRAAVRTETRSTDMVPCGIEET